VIETPWKNIVCKCSVRADEHIIGNVNTAPNLNTAFDSDAISYECVSFDKDPITDITVFANDRTEKNMRERPYP